MAPYEESIFIVAVLAFGAFVCWLWFRFAGERARERERRSRFVEAQIERFGEAGNFVAFARTEAGLAWLRADSGEMRVKRGLLALAIAGFFFLALGAALFVNAARLAGAIDPGDIRESAQASWWGTVLVALGAGSLVASLVIARVARAWGFLPPAAARGHETSEE